MEIGAKKLEVVKLENEFITLEFIPQLGSKITKIQHKNSSHNFLLPPQDFPYKLASYNTPFEEYDTSGFDDCFPTVSACSILQNNESINFPDHGDIWSAQADIINIGTSFAFIKVDGTSFPYSFHKKINLSENKIVLNYEVISNSEQAQYVLWSAHPLLSISENSQILLPPEVKNLFVNWSLNNRLGQFADTISWPVHKNNDLSFIGNKNLGFADKLFTEKLTQGICGYYHHETNEHILYKFSTKEIPYIGVWICQGGWPQSRNSQHYTVALEPCFGMPDSVSYAAKNKSCILLPSMGKYTWNLEIILGRDLPKLEDYI
ncbi:MAG: DUF5107 domain-containing protein [Bdellovibrionota bacterium]